MRKFHPKKKKSICDWLTIYLSDCWGCGRNEIFWRWAMRFHGLLCIRTDGMSTDYSPSLSYIRQPRKKKNNWLYIHSTQQQLTHTHHDEFRACASALNNKKKKPPETFTDWLVCPVFIDLSIRMPVVYVCTYSGGGMNIITIDNRKEDRENIFQLGIIASKKS